MQKLLSRLFSLALPVTLARLGIMTMGLCDAVVVGRLAPSELPHQALGWAPTSVTLVTSIGLLVGVQVLAARACGAQTLEEAGGALQRGLVVSAISGALAIAVAYAYTAPLLAAFGIEPELVQPSARITHVLILSVPLHLVYVSCAFFVEAIQRPVVSTWLMWIANLINLLLNLLLVPRMGALGSAWSTVGARGFLACALLLWVLRLPEARELGLRKRVKTPSYADFLRVGGAAAVSQAAESSAFSGMTVLAGRLGGHAVASYQILLNLIAIVFMVALGFGTATAVLTAEAVGKNSPHDVSRASWVGLAVNSGAMALIGLFTYVLARPIASAYTVDTAVAQLVATCMPLAAAIMIFDGGQTVAASALRSQNDNWFPTGSHLLAYAVIMPGLGYVLAELQGLGVRGLMLAVFWASIFSVGVLASRLWWLTRARALPP
ncbi:MAG TPA: MATE family efflux transporter [Polyangiales bacterium]|nr:MATE family efflux transporter [Polyangiales bacterium]